MTLVLVFYDFLLIKTMTFQFQKQKQQGNNSKRYNKQIFKQKCNFQFQKRALTLRNVHLEITAQIKKELSRFFSLKLILISLCKSVVDVLFKLILFFIIFLTMQSSFQCQNFDQLHDSEQIYKKPKKQSNYEHSINSGKWKEDQILKYIIFIEQNRQSLAIHSKRRVGKVFKEMAKFIETRNAIQCRSHHQKQLEKFKSTSKIIIFFKNQYGQASYNLKVNQFLSNFPKQQDIEENLLKKKQSSENQYKKSVETQTDIAGIDKTITIIQNHQSFNTVSNFEHYSQQNFSFFPTFTWNPSFFYDP